ncbi:MAG: methyltransferase domain-containing protein [Candidatus Rokubacteria bacterium]|nr:methyltransferase domain-containing protein [Candidatus Rokubacteria bacterium]MBI3105852.1 methyltransferase domain-containing protein [Candidatus Rokubacteria bacterium]
MSPAGSPRPWPEPVRRRVAEYYTRYYRDTLGIPAWAALVEARLDEETHEAMHLDRLEAALGRTVAGLAILNVGCGTGGFTVIARRAGAAAMGVDTEPEAVEICRLKAAAEGAGGPILAAAEHLPFSAGAFDLVYCFSTLEHVADAAAAVREMVRVVRTGGALYLHAPSALACYEGHYKLFWLPGMPRTVARCYLRLRGRPTRFVDTLTPLLRGPLERLLRDAGTRIVPLGPSGTRARESGSPLWPMIRGYYRLFRISPSIEILAWK